MKTSTKTNQSVEKVFQIIEVMASNKGPIKLQEVSQKLGACQYRIKVF